MAQWPTYITYAFEQLGYEDYVARIKVFTDTWGDLALETFTRVLYGGQDEDRVISIFVVGSRGDGWVRELLLPFLQSVQPMERWASTLCLGKMKEDQALPYLLHMLEEFFPPKERPAYEGGKLWLFNNWRVQTILLLINWIQPEVVTALLHALRAYRQLEMMPENNDISRRYWRGCQEHIMYVLGWSGCFDVLNELESQLEIVQPTLSSWRIYLVLGFLHIHPISSDKISSNIFSRAIPKQSSLRNSVKEILKERFDLSPEEQEQCLVYHQIQRLW